MHFSSPPYLQHVQLISYSLILWSN